MSRCLVNAVHPTVFLLWISLSWFLSIITFVFDLFIFGPWLSLSSANSCCSCCSSCGVLAHMSMSSAKRRWLRYSPSIFKPLVSQVSRRNMVSSAAVNSLDDMVSLCRTRLLMLILLLSLCTWTVMRWDSSRSSMYTSSIPCSWSEVSTTWVCTESKAFS